MMKIGFGKYKFFNWVGLLVLFFGMVQCNSKKQVQVTDTLTSGTLHISIDESYKPVMDEQIKSFEGSNPDAKIIAHYKSESACLNDILNDSLTKMVIVTRGLTRKEENYFKESLHYQPRWDELATDAIAIVVN